MTFKSGFKKYIIIFIYKEVPLPHKNYITYD
jgi:hypothetical protein